MAEILLSPLLQVIFDKLASLALERLELGGSFKQDFERLKRTLPVIQAVIEDAEKRQLKDRKVMIWLTRLKDVVYDADDLLDELNTQVLRSSTRKNKEVWKSYLSFEPFTNYFTMSRKQKDIREKLDDIVKEMSDFQFKEADRAYERSDTRERRKTGPYLDETEVYGRKDDAEKIVDLLTSTHMSNSMDVSIIPIVGIGGIGKTTLAQLAYNDQRVTQHFDLRMWVSVYDNFNVRKIINEILDYAAKHNCDSSQIGVLQSQLWESLSGKRYLLVLDDVWNEDQDAWDKLKNPLRGGADGSKILVTTRSIKVASMMSNTPPYVLGALADDDCWSLFKQGAFPEGGEEANPNLLPIGKQIVKKCRGVPLAAKILGRLMRYKREEIEWSHVEGSELWNLDEGDHGILSVLRLSYNHLPPHLKRCFAYCAVFPKNYEMSREKLIHLWIAEGLIQEFEGFTQKFDDRLYKIVRIFVPFGGREYYDESTGKPVSIREDVLLRNSTLTMEDNGNEYFNDLLLMCFFQAVSKCPNGRTTKFIMHDLIHDLARSVAGNEFSILGNVSAPNTLTKILHSSVRRGKLAQTRHASVLCNFQSSLIPACLCEAKKLRTLSLLSLRDDTGTSLLTAIRVFKHLRVLDLSGSGIQRLHKSIGGLIYLRYLDLSNTLIETLPETVGNLCNLQTLNLSGCSNLIRLPSGLTDLINLRHLNIKDCGRLTCMPANIGMLLNLITLPIFIVGHNSGEGILELMNLPLRGELKIRQLENVGYDFCKDLLHLMKLHSLGLSWRNDNEGKLDQYSPRQAAGGTGGVHEERVLQWLNPNSILRRLSIAEYSGLGFPYWMNEVSLPNLTELVLINCKRCEYLPTLGQLPLLKVLNIQGMDAVVSIHSKFYGQGESGDRSPFPSLNELTLKDFPNLKSWEGINSKDAFTCLDRLLVINCPRLSSMPWFPSLRNLELQNCDGLVLRSAAEVNSLSTLVIRDFPEISFLPKALLPNKTLLTSLTVRSCHKIESLPTNLGNLAALKSLTIGWCNALATLPYGLRNLTSLEKLEIIQCPRLIDLPMGNLTALKSLTIRWCNELNTLPHGLRNLISLENLEIIECPRLISFPQESIEGLSSLRSFSIENCENLTSLPIGMEHLKALEHLTIMYCPKLAYLPDGLQHLLALRSLTILSCPELASLPEGLQHVKTLQSLEIRICPNLKNFPERVENLISLRSLAISECENIKSLPEGLQHLTALQHLSIRDCRELEERCKKERGEDWHKISHIPYIYIGMPADQLRQESASSSSNP